MKNLFIFILAFAFLLDTKAQNLSLEQESLFKALKDGQFERFKSLIEKGENPNLRNQSGSSLLHLSIEKGDRRFFDFLIEKGADVEIKGTQNDSPLHWAVLEESTYYTEKLIKKGALIDSRNEIGKTPLHFASFYGENGVSHMKILLKNKADVNAQDHKGKSALHHSITDSEDVEQKVKLLFQNKADLNLKDKLGLSTLHVITRLKYRKGMVRLMNKVISFLIESGAKVNVTDNFGRTPLMEAVDTVNVGIAKTLIFHNADLFKLDHSGRGLMERIPSEYAKDADQVMRLMILQEIKRKGAINRSQVAELRAYNVNSRRSKVGLARVGR